MNFIHQKLECGEFQDVFKEMKIKTESLIGSEYCLDANLDVVLSSSVAGEDGNDRSATLSITGRYTACCVQCAFSVCLFYAFFSHFVKNLFQYQMACALKY